MQAEELKKLTVSQLREMAKERGLTGLSKQRKNELIELILQTTPPDPAAYSPGDQKASAQGSQAVSPEEPAAAETGEASSEPTPEKKADQPAEEKTDKEKTDQTEEKRASSEKADKSETGEGRQESRETKAEDETRTENAASDRNEHRKSERTRPQNQTHGEKSPEKTAPRVSHENHEHRTKVVTGRERGPERNGSDKRKKTDRYARIKDDITNTIEVSGPLSIHPEGFGLVANDGMQPPYDHIYVSPSQIQKFKLRTGDILGGKVRSPKPGEKYAAMLFLEVVNGTETRQILDEMAQLMRHNTQDSDTRFKESHTGILDVNPEGYGFLRTDNYLPGENDIYVAANQIRRYGLATGDRITGKIRKSAENEKNDALLYIEKVNGDIPEIVAHRPKFENLLPVFPDERITLETKSSVLSTRMIDLFSPVGKGQRGMIVAPPKAGKTTLLKDIARGIRQNHPEIELIILLVDERPEEVTDMRRSIDADIVCSTFDQPAQNHLAAAQMVLERGKRLVEQGKDVVILVDSLTRLTRANNLVIEPSGRTLSGGIDPESLYFPKKFFGSARNIEGGGSLTIIATALVETGSRMDDIVYEEFKGTGNMELHLERELAERRIYPAINLLKSGTRREDLLLTEKEIKASFAIRKMYGASPVQMTDKVITALGKTPSNEEFLSRFIKEKPES